MSKMFRCSVILKVETLNPVRSFKGRGSELLTNRSDRESLVCASAGNFGQAMAWSCRLRGINLTVYASVNANPFKVARMKDFGANVVQYGEDFDEAKVAARKFASDENIRFVEDSLDVETAIGAGTIGIELAHIHEFIDTVLVPLGNGALVNGIATAMAERSPDTKIVAVQSINAPAMVESWQSKKIVVHDKIETIADGIGVRIPVIEAVEEMRRLVHQAMLVKEETLIRAMQLIRSHAGILIEPSAAVGLAAMLENPELFTGKTVALILTGSNLTEQQVKQWFH
ncbi:MAG TPA: pyridoxal-phosphate dependent enzyme [Cyclobacteriaceae bacterium]